MLGYSAHGELSVVPVGHGALLTQEELSEVTDSLGDLSLPPPPMAPTASSHWLAIDGVQPPVPQNPPPRAQDDADPASALQGSGTGAVSAARGARGERAVSIRNTQHVLSREMTLLLDVRCEAAPPRCSATAPASPRHFPPPATRAGAGRAQPALARARSLGRPLRQGTPAAFALPRAPCGHHGAPPAAACLARSHTAAPQVEAATNRKIPPAQQLRALRDAVDLAAALLANPAIEVDRHVR